MPKNVLNASCFMIIVVKIYPCYYFILRYDKEEFEYNILGRTFKGLIIYEVLRHHF